MSTANTQTGLSSMNVSEQEHLQLTLLAEKIANEFNLDIEEVFNRCLPEMNSGMDINTSETTTLGETKIDEQQLEPMTPISKKVKKPKKVKITNYKDATVLEDLKVFKLKELKAILIENNRPAKGSKKVLMESVWNLVNNVIDPPTDMSVVEETKEGVEETKSGENSTVELIESVQTKECELDPSIMPVFYVKDNIKVDEAGEGVDVWKLFKNKWLFQENGDELDFKGYVNDDGSIEITDDVPEELIKMLGM